MKIFVANEHEPVGEDVKSALQAAGHTYNDEDDVDWSEIESIKSYAPDAIVLETDIGPDTGVNTFLKWRKAGIDTPVLLMTAPSEWDQWSDAFVHWGVNDVISRPFDEKTFIHRLSGIANEGNKKPFRVPDYDQSRPADNVEYRWTITDEEIEMYNYIFTGDHLIPLADFLDYLKQIDDFTLVATPRERKLASNMRKTLLGFDGLIDYMSRDDVKAGKIPSGDIPHCHLDRKNKEFHLFGWAVKHPSLLDAEEYTTFATLVDNIGRVVSYYHLLNPNGDIGFSWQHEDIWTQMRNIDRHFPNCFEIRKHLGVIARMDGKYPIRLYNTKP